MIQITDKSKCCGCTACYSVCPKHCITMEYDNEGFLYPHVNHSECIACNLCEKTCPFNHTAGNECEKSLFAAIQYRNEAERASSTAGGVFSLLADQLIEDGAYVYAVGYANNMLICHKGVNRKSDLEELRGSKYVQSTLNDSFEQIKKKLNEGTTVLFVGTPCQVHGLRNVVGENERLYIIDILCLGVSSPKLYMRWVEYLQKKYHDSVVNIQFRNKKYGYATPNVRVYFSDKKPIDQRYETRVHSRLFFDSYNVRPSCYECNFRTIPRVSDFTIGDFTDIENYVPEMNDFKGTTRTWIHTPKGKALMDKVCGIARIEYLSENGTNVIGGARKQIKCPDNRDEFWEDTTKLSYSDLVSKWEPRKIKDEVIRYVRPLLNRLPIKNGVQNLIRKKRDKKFRDTVHAVNNKR